MPNWITLILLTVVVARIKQIRHTTMFALVVALLRRIHLVQGTLGKEKGNRLATIFSLVLGQIA